MSSQIFIEIALLLFLFLLNGIFAMAELAIVSSRRERLLLLADNNPGARVALELADDPSNLLSTVQVGITLIGILAGAFGGATLTAELAALLDSVPVVGPYAEGIALVLVVSAITYGSVVLGELAPKQLALRSPERLAAMLARPMNLLLRLTRPVVRLLNASTALLLRVMGVRADDSEQQVSEQEIQMMIDQGAAAGIFEAAERDMLAGIFRFGDQRLRSLMTPRTEIVWIDINDDLETIRQTVLEAGHSRFPLCDGSIDRVIGIVLARDLLEKTWLNQSFDLRVLARPALLLPEMMPAMRALERFKETGIQAAMLVDEFGGIEGMVTIMDMMAAIVGDIPTPSEISDPPVVRREDGSLLVDGQLDTDDLKRLLNVTQLPEAENYQTLGGFLVMRLGRLPRAGDIIDWSGFRFEIMDMDGNRVDKVLIREAE